METIAAVIAAAVCIAIGYGLGQLRAGHAISRTALCEAKVDLLRQRTDECQQDLGQIYKLLQEQDVKTQKKLNADLDEIGRMMKEATGESMPNPDAPLYPKSGHRL